MRPTEQPPDNSAASCQNPLFSFSSYNYRIQKTAGLLKAALRLYPRSLQRDHKSILALRTYVSQRHQATMVDDIKNMHLLGKGAPSTAAFTAPPASDDPTVIDGLWDGRTCSVPWPDSVYIIRERGTNQAICLGKNSRLYLSDDPQANNRWRIVDHQGYFGFVNQKTGKYMGHNQKRIHAAVSRMADWESFVPRQHPEGGYHLLSPVYSHTMMFVSVTSDGKGVERRQHPETRWEFVKV